MSGEFTISNEDRIDIFNILCTAKADAELDAFRGKTTIHTEMLRTIDKLVDKFQPEEKL